MVIIMGSVRIDRDNLAAARTAMETMVLASRAEPGCRHYAYAEDMLEPGLIRVSEQWTDREALAAHFASDHMTAWRAALPGLGLRDRELQIIEAEEPEPL